MKFTVDGIEIELAEENGGIRLTTRHDDNVILPDQTMASVENIVKENLQIVRSYYLAKSGVPVSIDERDLTVVSLKLVLHYLYMYNMWRKMYQNHKARDLKFQKEDLESPGTHDMIIAYFKNKYPDGYSAMCAHMLGISVEAFRHVVKIIPNATL